MPGRLHWLVLPEAQKLQLSKRVYAHANGYCRPLTISSRFMAPDMSPNAMSSVPPAREPPACCGTGAMPAGAALGMVIARMVEDGMAADAGLATAVGGGAAAWGGPAAWMPSTRDGGGGTAEALPATACGCMAACAGAGGGAGVTRSRSGSGGGLRLGMTSYASMAARPPACMGAAAASKPAAVVTGAGRAALADGLLAAGPAAGAGPAWPGAGTGGTAMLPVLPSRWPAGAAKVKSMGAALVPPPAASGADAFGLGPAACALAAAAIAGLAAKAGMGIGLEPASGLKPKPAGGADGAATLACPSPSWLAAEAGATATCGAAVLLAGMAEMPALPCMLAGAAPSSSALSVPGGAPAAAFATGWLAAAGALAGCSAGSEAAAAGLAAGMPITGVAGMRLAPAGRSSAGVGAGLVALTVAAAVAHADMGLLLMYATAAGSRDGVGCACGNGVGSARVAGTPRAVGPMAGAGGGVMAGSATSCAAATPSSIVVSMMCSCCWLRV